MKEQKPTRARKYGTALASLVNYIVNASSTSEIVRNNYRVKAIKELKNYSFEPRKEGEPINSGCTYELRGLNSINIKNPEEFARLLKEGILMYPKQTARKVMSGLLEDL